MAPSTAPPTSVPANTASSPAPADGSLPVPATPRQRWLLRLAFCLFIAWWLGLAALCVLTANPALVSRDQLAQSEFIVSARLPGIEDDQVTIEHSWRGDLKPGKIRVVNLPDADRRGIPPNSEVILPLKAFGSDYRITTLETQTTAPWIYPATTQVLDEVRRNLPPVP